MTGNTVSMSITSAIVYAFSGGLFFLLIFLLIMIGISNCNWECKGCCSCCWCFRRKKRKSAEVSKLDWKFLDLKVSSNGHSVPHAGLSNPSNPPAPQPRSAHSRQNSDDSVIQMTF
eukprot:TRINITY_DN31090_c0_g1_i1.p1 TRINITY_DN31090_c0_g1~~TRINITY_DN31090_c0_g1_i1.p1  ORF type:complete len:116 (-),score=28.49 TRINITY_DN31090_c0_g1_i1:303-650(-)